MAFSIREKQKEAIVRMLNLGRQPSEQPAAQRTFDDEPWKLLVYDAHCRDIISPLLRLGELRKHGVTLHLLFHAERDAVPDVPAVYFVSPTSDNIKRLAEDCKARLYDSVYINFSSSVPRPLLEQLASSMADAPDATASVSKVVDQRLDFVSLERDLFTLNIADSYSRLNDPTLSDPQIEATLGEIVDGLLGALLTMGVVPIIRAPRTGAAAELARALDTRLADMLSSSGGGGTALNDSTPTFQRPVLVLLDRSVDTSVMVGHTWTYQALLADVLGLHLNKLQLHTPPASDDAAAAGSSKVYDLDQQLDAFWAANAGAPFPNIPQQVKNALSAYTAELDKVQQVAGPIAGLAGPGAFDSTAQQVGGETLGRTRELGALVQQIPQLREQKAQIDAHTNIATALLKEIKHREIDSYVSLEDALIQHQPYDKKDLEALLSDVNRGTAHDKVRLLLVWFLQQPAQPTPPDLEHYLHLVQRAGGDLAPFHYTKRVRALQDSIAAIQAGPVGGGAASSSAYSARGIKDTLGLGSVGGAVSAQLAGLFSAGIKALLPASTQLPVTRIVEALVDLKPDLGVNESYLYLDPKLTRKLKGQPAPRRTTPFKECIVFVCGAGCYPEYQNVQEYAKRSAKNIVYGCTQLATPEEFLRQLKDLAPKLS
eukprot:TRINITY_DN1145_c0_g1_i1.p1 TRINITY_DN1145_c0_g1~~TRINITY_DN1145_c0_g1_i1.p1  ORF type:complete len:655 (-),score=235.21 TRINITY_DN1145_c0_g1_i1:3921-5885(-)